MTYILSAVSPLPPADAPAERHMSRLIEERLPGGSVFHPMSIIEVSRNEQGLIAAYVIYPFERELPFTTFHSVPLVLEPASAVHIP